MKRYFVYILKCKDESFYTGVTNNLERRLAEHNEGGVSSYTYTRRPVELVYCEETNDIMQAIALEKQIKGWSRKKKEAFINEDWERLRLYAKNYIEIKKKKDNHPPSSSSG